MALQCQRSQYPSEGRKQLHFPCGLCNDFWPSQPLASQDAFWVAASPQRAGSPLAGTRGVLAGRKPPWQPRCADGPPLPLILPLAGCASVPRDEAAAGPAAPAAWLPSAASIPTSPSANEPVVPAQEGGEGLEKKSDGEKKSPFLGGAANSEAFVCPCPPAPAGRPGSSES